MATSCFGRPDPETPELDTFIVEDAGPPGTPLVASPAQRVAPPQGGHQAPPHSSEDVAPTQPGTPGSGAAPSDPPAEDAGLPLEHMRPKIEDGLLTVVGPEGDPVPPYAFAKAAAARPDALVGLPDGTTARASRIAAALGAQILGRLGAADQGADWILTMLRDGPPDDAAEDARSAEQEMLDAIRNQLTAAVDGSGTAAGEVAGAPATLPSDHPGHRDAASGSREALDQAALDQAAAGSELGPESLPRLELDLKQLVASAEARLDLDFAADRVAAKLPRGEPGDAPLLSDLADLPHGAVAPAGTNAGRDVDPDSIVLVVMRGVPADAVLSSGVRDDDGTWSISPLDLPTVTISLSQSSGCAAGAVPDAHGDLSITGIALADDGELVAISESVPLADYLADPGSGDPAGKQHGAKPAGDPAVGPEPGLGGLKARLARP